MSEPTLGDFLGGSLVNAADLMSEDEHLAMKLSGELANVLKRICYDGDTGQAEYAWGEMCAHIHNIQRAVKSQAASRAFPDKYRLLGGWPKGES